MIKRYFCFLLCALSMIGYGQNSLQFQRVHEFYIAGNTRVIGNNILSDHKSKPYDKAGGLNDQIKMEYVDIDDDRSTFSSSSASLIVPDNATITYAGLYWSGTYPGSAGKKKTVGNRIIYELEKEREAPINRVKIKLPGEKYRELQGQVIYDSFKSEKDLTENNFAPYVSYADITDILKNRESLNGEYTLANIPALEGYMYGGSSAGWMIYVVYEEESEPLQYITTYHGFEFIDRQHAVTLNFENFRSVEKGETTTLLTIGALEGDNPLRQDQIELENPQSKNTLILFDENRPFNNFFNSSISALATISRNPASSNTLGFDIARVRIPEDNPVIGNETSSVNLNFTTRADRYAVFFTSFQTTISKEFFEKVKARPSAAVKVVQDRIRSGDTLSKKTNSKEEKIEEIKSGENEDKKEVKIAAGDPDSKRALYGKDGNPINGGDMPARQEVTQGMAVRTLKRAKPAVIPGVEPGYYIVTNVFAVGNNAEKWFMYLRDKGFKPGQFENPKNDLSYIYIDFNTDPESLYGKLNEIREDADFKESWIYKVNID